jgi:cytochrome b involved in lipid metabolism
MSTPHKTLEEWLALGRGSDRSLVFFQNKVVDLTTYIDSHPGGKRAIANHLNTDVTTSIFTVFQHKGTVVQMLLQFVIGEIAGKQVGTA